MLQIKVPTLVIDSEKAKRNIQRMSQKADQAGVHFRPHFKTHQSSTIGSWFRDAGVNRIAVSSLRMAKYFAIDQWSDILLAIPVNLNEISEINELGTRINLGITVECDVTVALLNRELNTQVDVYIELDTGYHRTGILWDDYRLIDQVIERIDQSDRMIFKGFLVHAGETYQVRDSQPPERRKTILDILLRNNERLKKVKEHYQDDFPELTLSYGDTPSCSLGDHFGAATEIRPGNFVFYDLIMQNLGVCDYNDIAVAMACPVIGLNHKRREAAIYGGAVHFSKDSIATAEGLVFGQMVQSSSLGWGSVVDGARLVSLSQEHGIVRFDNELAFRRIGIGDLLWFLPVHSCLTAEQMGQYLTLDGETLSTLSS